MTAGLNLARTTWAAESREGSASSLARSSRQAVLREIGSAPAVAMSVAFAASASGEKVAMRLYFRLYFDAGFIRTCYQPIRHWQSSYWLGVGRGSVALSVGCLRSWSGNLAKSDLGR